MKIQKNPTQASPLTDGFVVTQNSVDADVLLSRLARSGGWDAKRRKMTDPFFETIKNTWRRLVEQEDLVQVFTCQDKEGQNYAHHVLSRVTSNGLLMHSLASNSPLAATPMLMTVIGACYEKAIQSWFVPASNGDRPGYTEQIMGKRAVSKIEDERISRLCRTSEFQYLYVKPNLSLPESKDIAIEPVSESNYREFLEFLARHMSDAYVKNEEFDGDDPFLKSLDERYRQIGFKRRRYMYLAYLRGTNNNDPVGVMVNHVGPFGLNLRYLEGRTEMFFAQPLTETQKKDICNGFIQTMVPYSINERLGFLPIITKENGVESLDQHDVLYHIIYHKHMIIPANTKLIDHYMSAMGGRLARLANLTQRRRNR